LSGKLEKHDFELQDMKVRDGKIEGRGNGFEI